LKISNHWRRKNLLFSFNYLLQWRYARIRGTYAVEVRHHSWFQDLAYNFFAYNNICLVWSQLAKLITPSIVTTDFLYVRFIGDRSINEIDFQRDRVWK
jgi:uncharacterized protein YecE (DUF72 family)